MIVCVISFLIGKWFSPISPDLKKLADEGKIFTREHDKNLLLQIDVEELIEKNALTLNVLSTFQDLLDVVKHGKRNKIAVLNEGELAGVVYLDDLRPGRGGPGGRGAEI